MVSCFLLEKNSGETFQIDQGGSPFEGGLVFPAKRGILIRSGDLKKSCRDFRACVWDVVKQRTFAFAFIIILYVNMRTYVDVNPVKNPSGT